MSMWTNYTQSMPAGVAGGLYDLTEHVVDSRMNEAAGLKFGMGVVQGETAGKTVKLPATGATIDKFEGINMCIIVQTYIHIFFNNRQLELD